MLVEMMSPAFKEKDEVRPSIRFKEGLNVVLGKEEGTNSIGKSSALLAIDFVFGGNTYIASDGVKHIGDHTIFFTFKFDGKEYNIILPEIRLLQRKFRFVLKVMRSQAMSKRDRNSLTGLRKNTKWIFQDYPLDPL